MQLLGRYSEEGQTDLLGILPFDVVRFPTLPDYKVPHMGWNNLRALRSPLFNGLTEQDYVYFVHSYYVPLGSYTIAQAEYPAPFSAAVRHENFYAVQFHTEKSGPVGARILENFLNL
jgi:glutamine amidotransferase